MKLYSQKEQTDRWYQNAGLVIYIFLYIIKLSIRFPFCIVTTLWVWRSLYPIPLREKLWDTIYKVGVPMSNFAAVLRWKRV